MSKPSYDNYVWSRARWSITMPKPKRVVKWNLGNIAGFFFADFACDDSNCDYQVVDLLAVDIDLDTNETSSEILILL